MEVREIQLPNGKHMYIEFNDAFLKVVRMHLDIDENSPITDEQIRVFVHDAMQNAIDKATNGSLK